MTLIKHQRWDLDFVCRGINLKSIPELLTSLILLTNMIQSEYGRSNLNDYKINALTNPKSKFKVDNCFFFYLCYRYAQKDAHNDMSVKKDYLESRGLSCLSWLYRFHCSCSQMSIDGSLLWKSCQLMEEGCIKTFKEQL